MESTAMGILAARQFAVALEYCEESLPSQDTMIGALLPYISEKESSTSQPMNASFSLLNALEKKMSKSERRTWCTEIALKKARQYADQV